MTEIVKYLCDFKGGDRERWIQKLSEGKSINQLKWVNIYLSKILWICLYSSFGILILESVCVWVFVWECVCVCVCMWECVCVCVCVCECLVEVDINSIGDI